MNLTKSSFFAFAFSSLSTLGLLAACTASTTHGPIAQADFESAYVHAVCDNIEGCCAQTSFHYGRDACADALQKKHTFETGAVYDAEAAGRCIDQVSNFALSCTSLYDIFAENKPVCDKVFSGAKQLGEECTKTEECATSSQGRVLCNGWTDAKGKQTFQCVVWVAPTEGQYCEANVPRESPAPTVQGNCTGFDPSFHCNRKTSQCEANRDGSTCTTNFECAIDRTCKQGVCTPRAALGAACSAYDCALGLYCDDGTCAEAKKPGAKCTDAAECGVGGCQNGVCVTSVLASAETCSGT